MAQVLRDMIIDLYGWVIYVRPGYAMTWAAFVLGTLWAISRLQHDEIA